MKKYIDNKWTKWGLLLMAIVITCYFFPRQERFKYQFQEGKPWRYGLLTASFDFPIYKSDQIIGNERDSLLKSFVPYYKIDPSVIKMGIINLKKHALNHPNVKSDSHYLSYVQMELQSLYQQGVILPDEYEKLLKNGITRIKIIDNNQAVEYPLEDIYTIKSAYEHLINNAPEHLSKAILKSFDLNKFIEANLIYDDATSEKRKEEMFESLSTTSGMVQSGEKIIDRGEIITHNTYNVLRSLQKINTERGGLTKNRWMSITGQIILVSMIFGVFYLFIYFFRRRLLHNNKNILLIMLLMVTTILITEFSIIYDIGNEYLIPYTIVPIIMCTFFDSRIAFFSHLCIILLCSLMVRLPFEFIFMQLLAGVAAVYSLKDLTQRSQLFRAALLIFFGYTMSYTGFVLINEVSLDKINYLVYIFLAINCGLLLFAYLLIFVLEKLFGMTSSVTLVELSNISSPLLQRFSEHCPGTFQHSMQVSNLASEAALKIGANAQLVRTGALYHDLGKLSNPSYYVENQNIKNPHADEDIIVAAQKVISHVEEGVKIAEKEQLPRSIIDFIHTHHGKNKALYFYNKYILDHPNQPFDDSLFTYPGPYPFSKETSILMMADAVEAASRSLPEYSQENINNLVDKIIDHQILQGSFQDSPISFRDTEIVKEVFKKKLQNIYHSRIAYPELDKK